MKQNELKNNDIEKYGNANRYKRMLLQKKVAEIFAKISIFILLVCICILGAAEFITVNPRYETNIGISVKASDMLIIILYCVSGIFAMIGFLIQKTNLTRVMFIFTVAFPVGIAVSSVTCFFLLYILFYPLIQLAWSSI